MSDLGRTIDKLRNVGGDDWRLRQILLFIVIAEEGQWVTYSKLNKIVNLDQQVVNRLCQPMLPLNTNRPVSPAKQKLAGFLETRPSPEDSRYWEVRLSKKGKAVWEELRDL